MPKKKTKEEEQAEAEERARKEAKKQKSFFSKFTSFFSQQNFLKEIRDMFSQAFKRREDDPVSTDPLPFQNFPFVSINCKYARNTVKCFKQ